LSPEVLNVKSQQITKHEETQTSDKKKKKKKKELTRLYKINWDLRTTYYKAE